MTVFFKQSVVRLLERHTMIPDASGGGHYAVKTVPLSARIHSEFIGQSHLCDPKGLIDAVHECT